ncbi:MAG: glycoside hydrolase family 16 protein [Clostridia bacterium]|nr:glycoside hydrolase family 16 protein [Clostridia bacterium]
MSIKCVNYKCVLDIPTADAIYKITSVIDENGNDITAKTKIVCDNNAVKICDDTIVIACDYCNSNNSITLSAVYEDSSLDFEIKIKKWNVVFEDDFDGECLDPTKWKHKETKRIDRGFLNYYNKDRTFTKDGCLVSRAYDTGGSRQGKKVCLTGAVDTKGLFEHGYGYYEFLVRPHQVGGMRVTLSIIAGDMDKEGKECPCDGWGKYGAEIRIVEMFRNFGINHNVGWDGYGENHKEAIYHANINHIDIYDGKFHKFALRWSPSEYIFLVDDIITRRTTAGFVCTEKGYLNIITECGTGVGNWALNCGESSDMLVDYVKVYSTDSDY